jgi:hypothetical protein
MHTYASEWQPRSLRPNDFRSFDEAKQHVIDERDAREVPTISSSLDNCQSCQCDGRPFVGRLVALRRPQRA